MTTKTAPAEHRTEDAVNRAQAHLDALEEELTWSIPKREQEIRLEREEARRRGDGDAVERLKQENFALARRHNEILLQEKPAAGQALSDARWAHVSASMALPTGTIKQLEADLEDARQHHRQLVEEQTQTDVKIGAALRGGDARPWPALLARKAEIPFELGAADSRVRRTQAGLLAAQIAEVEAELPALCEAVEVAEKALAAAQEIRNRAVEASRRRLEVQREAEGALRQHRRRFAAEMDQAT